MICPRPPPLSLSAVCCFAGLAWWRGAAPSPQSCCPGSNRAGTSLQSGWAVTPCTGDRCTYLRPVLQHWDVLMKHQPRRLVATQTRTCMLVAQLEFAVVFCRACVCVLMLCIWMQVLGHVLVSLCRVFQDQATTESAQLRTLECLSSIFQRSLLDAARDARRITDCFSMLCLVLDGKLGPAAPQSEEAQVHTASPHHTLSACCLSACSFLLQAFPAFVVAPSILPSCLP